MLERLAELGGKPLKGTPEDFGKVIAAEPRSGRKSSFLPERRSSKAF